MERPCVRAHTHYGANPHVADLHPSTLTFDVGQ